ncbi:MAG: glycosyltransferase family 2 protein [Terrimicrobiaceae bacterium]|nr:glycosyltransferase family 2 protein [Terrimicrobiaceae bacterium]
MPDFSIVTPSLNQGAFLGECLASVREAAARARVRVRHIVMDGGSRDDSLEILRSTQDIEWVSEADNGQTDAINKGLARVDGGIVSYLCADDLLEPDSLRWVGEAFSKSPEVDVVHGDALFLENGWKRRKVSGPFDYARLRRGNFLFQPAVFWRHGVTKRCGLLDASLRYCMDHEYWLRIGAVTRWHYIPEPLASCRLHADAKTWSSLVPAWDEAQTMQARYGIRWRPLRDALWMRFGGCHYYRLKRHIFAALARRRAA